MAITRILPEDIEVFTLETNPFRTFATSSIDGTTGFVHVFPRRSSVEKEVFPLSMFSSSFHLDSDLNSFLREAKFFASVSGSNSASMEAYLAAVDNQTISARKQQTVEILRFTPGVSFNTDFLRKSVVINTLLPFYRADYPTAHYSYTNYHSLNFFSSSTVPTASVLLYPQLVTSGVISGTITGSYIFSGSFTFDFWINPKYTTDTPYSGAFKAVYKAGTVMHLSSCYAVSLMTGSSLDPNGYPDKFRIVLQLSNSADVSPSTLNTSSLPALVFLSDDNSLNRNTWHHVTIRWGTDVYNNGTGSICIDETKRGVFVVPSASVTPKAFPPLRDNPTVLCVGNYYEGTNNGTNVQAFFFTTDTAQREGLLELLPSTGFEPTAYRFAHPLKAEIHDLKIYNRYLSDVDMTAVRRTGPSVLSNLLFYLPPFFTQEAPFRTFYNGSGGVLTTPFFTKDGTTKHPFAVEMAFDVGGHYINLENFARDFATGNYPRLLNLTGSAQAVPNNFPQTANAILYSTGSNRRRANMILPCDNGNFVPNFGLLSGSTFSSSLFKNDLGSTIYGQITLRDYIPTSSLFPGILNTETGSIGHSLLGPDPELSSTLGTAPGRTFTIFQRTRDSSSNQVVFFDISNLFYGRFIQPGTMVITDGGLSGSGGKVRLTLRDDKNGNLYRGDSTGSFPTWNSVGNIFYNEGIVMLKSPHLFFFGEDGYNISFNGNQTIHVLKINAYAKPLLETSSSNPSYLPVSASDAANDTDQKYVYITGIQLHDDNLNVISRTNFAQPVVKRSGDKLLGKIKIDF